MSVQRDSELFQGGPTAESRWGSTRRRMDNAFDYPRHPAQNGIY